MACVDGFHGRPSRARRGCREERLWVRPRPTEFDPSIVEKLDVRDSMEVAMAQ